MEQVPNIQPAPRFLRLPQVIARVGLQKSAIYDRIKEGTFPAPIKIGSASVWVEAEIEKWMAEQIEATRKAA